MNLIDKLTEITDRLKDITGKVDAIEFQNIRYRKEIKYILTLHPELKDWFSDATKEEADVII